MKTINEVATIIDFGSFNKNGKKLNFNSLNHD